MGYKLKGISMARDYRKKFELALKIEDTTKPIGIDFNSAAYKAAFVFNYPQFSFDGFNYQITSKRIKGDTFLINITKLSKLKATVNTNLIRKVKLKKPNEINEEKIKLGMKLR